MKCFRRDRWDGAVYYGIRQFDTREGRKYLLLGFDAFEFYQRRKLIEVLSFNAKTGVPVSVHPYSERASRKTGV
jgi:hypothetical protein